MRELKFVLLCFLLYCPLLGITQYNTPLALANRVFSSEPFLEIDQHCINEYNGHPNGTDLSGNTSVFCALIEQSDTSAVVHVEVTDPVGGHIDGYLHMIHDSVWKIEAFRSLAMTHFLKEVVEHLESLSEDQIDSVIVQSKIESGGYNWFYSRSEYNFILNNAKLTMAPDSLVMRHFQTNRPTFDSLNLFLNTEFNSVERFNINQLQNYPGVENELRGVLISSVGQGAVLSLSKYFCFTIGGLLDNTVGYVHIPEGNKVPTMSPDEIILLRPLGGGWYLFKTT